jgi:1,2-diacylglycerol 3-alpha-glucosyltransferase
MGWAARRAARAFQLPPVHTAHTMYQDYRQYLFFGRWVSPRTIQRYLRLFLGAHDALVCPSLKAQSYFQAFLQQIETAIIRNAVDRARFQPRPLTSGGMSQTRRALGVRDSDKVILYVGRLAQEKRSLELWRALAPLLRGHRQYKALFDGSGPAHEQMIDAARDDIVRGRVFSRDPWNGSRSTSYIRWPTFSSLHR